MPACEPLCANPAKCKYNPDYETVVSWVQPLYDEFGKRVLRVAEQLKEEYRMSKLPILILGGGSALDKGLKEVPHSKACVP